MRSAPKVVSILEKNGGQTTVASANAVKSDAHAYQQFSYRIAAKSVSKTVKNLGKIGRMENLAQSPSSYPGMPEEVKEKLSKLNADISANRDALAKMPAVSELLAELTDHLMLVDKVRAQAKEQILLHIELEEASH